MPVIQSVIIMNVHIASVPRFPMLLKKIWKQFIQRHVASDKCVVAYCCHRLGYFIIAKSSKIISHVESQNNINNYIAS